MWLRRQSSSQSSHILFPFCFTIRDQYAKTEENKLIFSVHEKLIFLSTVSLFLQSQPFIKSKKYLEIIESHKKVSVERIKKLEH